MSRTKLLVVAGAAALLITACSSSKKTGVASTNTIPPPVVTTAPGSTNSTTASVLNPTTTVAAPATAGLSGTWTGQYSGGFQGTFTLMWQQSGSTLSGTIKLVPGGTLSVNGTVNGGAIQFGTVGSQAITYSGSVSGNSMSGTYKVQGGNVSSGGNWSATKA
jgi:hypothetical protein